MSCVHCGPSIECIDDPDFGLVCSQCGSIVSHSNNLVNQSNNQSSYQSRFVVDANNEYVQVASHNVINQTIDQSNNRTINSTDKSEQTIKQIVRRHITYLQSINLSFNQINNLIDQSYNLISQSLRSSKKRDLEIMTACALIIVHRQSNYQSINRTVNQNNNQCGLSSVGSQSIDHSVDRSAIGLHHVSSMLGVSSEKIAKVLTRMIKQSVNQSSKQSNNQSIKQSNSQTVKQSNDQSISQSINQSTNVPNKVAPSPAPTAQSHVSTLISLVDWLPNDLIEQSNNQSNKQLFNPLISHSINASISQSNNQSINPFMNHPLEPTRSFGVYDSTYKRKIRSIDQSIKLITYASQLIDQSINQSIDQSDDESIINSITGHPRLIAAAAVALILGTHLDWWSIDQSINQIPIKQTINQIVKRAVKQSTQISTLLEALAIHAGVSIQSIKQTQNRLTEYISRSLSQYSLFSSPDQSINQTTKRSRKRKSHTSVLPVESILSQLEWLIHVPLTEQSISQLNNQSNNQTNNQSNNQTNNQTINQTDNDLDSESAFDSELDQYLRTDEEIADWQLINQSNNQPVYKTTNQSISQSINQTINPAENDTVTRSKKKAKT